MDHRKILLVPVGVIATVMVTVTTAWACTNLMGNITATGDITGAAPAVTAGNLSGFTNTCGSVTTQGNDDGTTFKEIQTVTTAGTTRACSSHSGGTVTISTGLTTNATIAALGDPFDRLPQSGTDTYSGFNYGAAGSVYYGTAGNTGESVDPLGHPSQGTAATGGTATTVGDYNVVYKPANAYRLTHENWSSDCISGDGVYWIGMVSIGASGTITAAGDAPLGAGDGVLQGDTTPTVLRTPAAFDNRPVGASDGKPHYVSLTTGAAKFTLPESAPTIGSPGTVNNEGAICISDSYQFYGAMAPLTLM